MQEHDVLLIKLMARVNRYLPEDYINTMAYWNMIDWLETIIDKDKLKELKI